MSRRRRRGGDGEFRRRIEGGAYAALFEGRLRDAVGEEGRGSGYSEELGALKVTLWKLLRDEEVDAARMAHAVSRVVGETLRVKKAELALAKNGGGMGFEGRLAGLLEVLVD